MIFDKVIRVYHQRTTKKPSKTPFLVPFQLRSSPSILVHNNRLCYLVQSKNNVTALRDNH